MYERNRTAVSILRSRQLTAVVRVCYPQQHTQDHDGMGMDAGHPTLRTCSTVHLPDGVSGVPLVSSEAVETFDSFVA